MIKLFKVKYSDLIKVCFSPVLFVGLTDNRSTIGKRLQLELAFYSSDENRMSQYDVKDSLDHYKKMNIPTVRFCTH